ncbi:hypothetical protein OUZ56_033359 [Daphnia magna]|uniref:30S ribosomal protein S21 n=1 Tax=Daphnia magna TaxID=35525 RepID=A0ABQ9ZXN6_9CRUS|nr:hypothetical protein OUZ56_033359 [Daphnia magna]
MASLNVKNCFDLLAKPLIGVKMNEAEPKSKRLKMDEYNERKKLERRKKKSFSWYQRRKFV